MRLKPFNPDKELKKANRKYTKKQLITTLLVLVVMITIGTSYAIFSIQPEYHTFVKSQVGEFSTGDIKLSVLVDGKKVESIPSKGSGYTYEGTECENNSTVIWDDNMHNVKISTTGPDSCTIKFKKYTLIDLLINQYQDGNSTGLIKDGTQDDVYYYVGTKEQVANNFLWYGGHQWRVIEFNTNEKTLTLISQQPLTAIAPASTVWTTENEYNNSFVNDWLNNYFFNSLNKEVQDNIVESIFNVGPYNNVTGITSTKKVGLLDVEQYNKAGGTNSFLDIKDFWLLGNGYDSNNLQIVGMNGDLYVNPLTSVRNLRAVIKINDIPIVLGDGTLTNNYRNESVAETSADIQVGEYIKIPYDGTDNSCDIDNECLFRVVAIDNDSLKVTLNGLLPAKSKFGDTTTISANSTVVTVLNAFRDNINDKYLDLSQKDFNIGSYGDLANYKNVASEKYSANVGLPTVGELFSGNDIDISATNTINFVDESTIENLYVSDLYWTLNRYDSTKVRRVNANGFLSSGLNNYAIGVRPVLFVKSGNNALNIVSGDGTAQKPYKFS